ncbi:hypothetical protein CDL12_09108 [Handroanthus impetiginosus]|uniref:Non-specific serine/threonine protein kinase n=1 Tax=Handroanthus impetiginosus TaxID=429701 RepID=A0A2G9HLA4_9LAMI|nr:hypothetical protein CDL12_09108 [Handroanthus impetiginosus]
MFSLSVMRMLSYILSCCLLFETKCFLSTVSFGSTFDDYGARNVGIWTCFISDNMKRQDTMSSKIENI